MGALDGVVVAGAAVVVLRLVKGRLVVVGWSVVNAEVGDSVVVVGVVTDATVVVVVVKKGTAERPKNGGKEKVGQQVLVTEDIFNS